VSNYDARRSTVLEPVTRAIRNYRHECPPLDNEVSRVAANYIATVTRPRDGSIVIATDSLRAAQLACTRLSATPGDGRIYSLIDDRPFEIVTVGTGLPSTGPLIGPTGLFLRAYRLVEKSGVERGLLRPPLVLIAVETVLQDPAAYPDRLISLGKSPRGSSYRLKPWRWLTEGRNKNHIGAVVRVRP